MTSLPSKLFFRIGEVAGLVGVEPHVLRYWEREFRSIRPTKSAKGQRVYSRKDVENLLRVRDLLYRDGFTIAGAKKRLQRPDGAAEPGDLAETETERGAFELAREPAESEDTHAQSSLDDEVAVDSTGQPGPDSLEPGASSAAREKLALLRAEVEAFLEELA